MPAEFVPAPAELARFLPEILLTSTGTLVMVLTPFSRSRRNAHAWLAMAGLGAALAAAVMADSASGYAFRGMLVVDGFATFFRLLVIVAGMLTVLCSHAYLRREAVDSGEYYALLLFSITGQCVMAAANELIMVFLGLEISSIASYVLAGYLREDRRSNESAIKYFLLGSFATACMLYGVAWIYGATGSTNLEVIRRSLVSMTNAPSTVLVTTGAALIFAGLAFKVAAWPFQSWAPDVYQGAPAPVAGFLSAGPKAAAFAVLIRIYMTAFGPVSSRWEPVAWVAALLTMMVGNFAALTQTNIKRLLAYSSIAHAGYLLVAVTAHSETGTAAAMFYLAAYALMNIGAFAVVAHCSRKGERYLDLQDFAGLAGVQPATAALLSIFLLSMIGVPLTAGFFGKFYIFKAALDSHLVWLAVLGLVNSAVAAYYYLRIIVVMYMHEPGYAADELPPLPVTLRAALWATAAGTLLLGIFPSLILDFAGASAALAR